MDVCLPAPKGLFPPEPEHYRGPKLKVAIIGAGLAGMSTAVELLDQGHEVWIIYIKICWMYLWHLLHFQTKHELVFQLSLFQNGIPLIDFNFGFADFPSGENWLINGLVCSGRYI